MSNTETTGNLFPLAFVNDLPPTFQSVLGAMNNLNDRLSAVETLNANSAAVAINPTIVTGADMFTAGDRAVLTEVAAFLGVHNIVANTVASRDAGVADIDPATGLPRVVPDTPSADIRSQPGGFSSSPVSQPGA